MIIKNKPLLVISLLMITCSIIQNSRCTILESLTTKALLDGGTTIYHYYYDNDPLKVTLERNLENYKPTIASECRKNFTSNCNLLAQHFKEAEKYYALRTLQEQKNLIHDPVLSALIDTDIEETQKTNSAQNNKSYFESLPLDKQTAVLQLMKNLIKEHNCQNNYAEELTKMYNALNK